MASYSLALCFNETVAKDGQEKRGIMLWAKKILWSKFHLLMFFFVGGGVGV